VAYLLRICFKDISILGYVSGGWNYQVGEHHIYGSSRIGVHQTAILLRTRYASGEISITLEDVEYTSLYRGKRHYELSNHLGNVQVVITDKRISVCDEYLAVERFEAEVLSAVDYYPFGQMMPDRQWYVSNDSSSYRFGFGRQLKDDEVKGIGICLSYQYRILDARLGRFLSVDPLEQSYPGISPFAFAQNRVIDGVDLEGAEWKVQHKWTDFVDQKTLKKQLGSDYIEGMQMTYIEYFRKRAPQLAEKHYQAGESHDCFDFVALNLIEFAAENKLNLKFENHSCTYKIELDQSVDYSFESGKWKSIYDEVADNFGAIELTKNTEMFNNIEWSEVQAGSLIATAWDAGGYHAQMISSVSLEAQSRGSRVDFDLMINVTQGSIRDDKATQIEKKQYHLNNLKQGHHDGYTKEHYESIKPVEWEFKYFDK